MKVNNKYRLDGVDKLVTTVRRVVRQGYVSSFNKALTGSRLNGLVNIRRIGATDTDFEYTPKVQRRIVLGDVNPASCRSTPMHVNRAAIDTQWGKTEEHEAAFDICIKDCKAKSPAEKAKENLDDLSEVLVAHLWHKFWFGNPQRLQYGLLNHELIQVVASPPNGNNGSTKWKDKTNSQIMMEIRAYIKYMKNPRILISESVYNEALATGDVDTGADRGCKLRIDCIRRLLADQPDINFTLDSGIGFLEELDHLEMYAGDSVVMIYDAGAIHLTSSGPIYLDAYHTSGKTVEQILSINTGGVEVDYLDSAFIITGV